jgi:pimeloyl-ACP methyl ester carboxylesterase
MYYEEYGSGPPMVLLHGGLLTTELTFGALMPALGKHARLIGVELQGHGHTADTDRPMELTQLADDVMALLDQLQLARADVFGFSLGGMVALELALRAPGRVGKLLIASVDHRPGDTELAPERLPGQADFQEMRDAYAAVAPDPKHFDVFASKTSAMVHAFPGWTEAQLGLVSAPTLLMFGDQDFAPLHHAVEMCGLIPGAQLAVLPDTTHMEVMRRTEILGPMVERFLHT